MTGSRNILRRAAEFDNSHNLLNEISGIRTNNVATEDFVRLRIRQDFHEPVRIAVAPRPAIRHERKPTGFVRATCCFQFLFRFADGGDFRPGINDTRNGIVVDVARLPCEDFRDNNTFVFRFVGQHGPRDTIADGVDTGHVGLEMGIDLDNAAREWADRLAQTAPLALAASKRLLRSVGSMSFGDAITQEGLEQTPLIKSNDFKEGVAAFFQKRKPEWTGT